MQASITLTCNFRYWILAPKPFKSCRLRTVGMQRPPEVMQSDGVWMAHWGNHSDAAQPFVTMNPSESMNQHALKTLSSGWTSFHTASTFLGYVLIFLFPGLSTNLSWHDPKKVMLDKCFTAGSPNLCAVRAVCCANVGTVKSSRRSEWIEGSKEHFVDFFFCWGGGSGRPKNTWPILASVGSVCIELELSCAGINRNCANHERQRERDWMSRLFAQTLTSLFSKAESAIQLHTVHINHHKSMFWFSTKTLHIISTHQTQKTRPFEYINTSHKRKSLLQNLIWLSNRLYSPIKTL